MMLTSYSNFVIIHFPKHTLLFPPSNVDSTDIKTPKKVRVSNSVFCITVSQFPWMNEKKKEAKVLELSKW